MPLIEASDCNWLPRPPFRHRPTSGMLSALLFGLPFHPVYSLELWLHQRCFSTFSYTRYIVLVVCVIMYELIAPFSFEMLTIVDVGMHYFNYFTEIQLYIFWSLGNAGVLNFFLNCMVLTLTIILDVYSIALKINFNINKNMLFNTCKYSKNFQIWMLILIIQNHTAK